MYVVPGSAIRLYDMWNYQFTLRAFKLESSYLSKKKKISDSTSELTIVGYHEYPEQIYSLLSMLKSGGAAICEPSQQFLRIVGSFIPSASNPRKPLQALEDAFDELERIESAKKELGWVRTFLFLPPLYINNKQTNTHTHTGTTLKTTHGRPH